MILSSFEKWSNYVHSCISGTHGVKVTPFWAGTKPLIPGQCGQPLRNETRTFAYHVQSTPDNWNLSGKSKKVRVTDKELENNSGSKEKNSL